MTLVVEFEGFLPRRQVSRLAAGWPIEQTLIARPHPGREPFCKSLIGFWPRVRPIEEHTVRSGRLVGSRRNDARPMRPAGSQGVRMRPGLAPVRVTTRGSKVQGWFGGSGKCSSEEVV